MSVELWGVVFLAGFLAQFVDVVTGMGFGVISSSLMLTAGVPPVLTVATVNLVKVGNGVFAGLSHWGFGNVRWKWVVPLSISGVVGALLGAALVSRGSEDALRFWVPVVLLALGGALLVRFLFCARGNPLAHDSSPMPNPDASSAEMTPRTVLSLVGIGFLAGFFNALSGAYGPFMTTLLMLTRSGPPRYIIGTVSLVELFVAGASAFRLLPALGSYAFPFWLPLALMGGGLIAAPWGAYLCRHLPARALEGVVGVAVVGLNLWNVLRAFG
jgi:uncharacterized membrane protein YfcA